MIERDRVMLPRLAQVNRGMSQFVIALAAERDGVELPAEGLDTLADELALVAAELRTRAAEIRAGTFAEPVTPLTAEHEEAMRALVAHIEHSHRRSVASIDDAP